MKITVTNTSKSIYDLCTTAGYDMDAIGDNAIKGDGGNHYGIYIEVPVGGNTIYLDNFVAVTSGTGKAIASGENFSLDLRDITKLYAITATTQDIIIMIV